MGLLKDLKDILKDILSAPTAKILCVAGVIVMLASPVEYDKQGLSYHGHVHWAIAGLGFALVVMGGLVFWWQQKNRPPIPNPQHTQSYPYGVKFKKTIWRHYYFSNYDFKAVMENFVTNVSDYNVDTLPPEQAGWFGENIEFDFKPKIFGDDSGIYTIGNKYLSKARIVRNDINGTDIIVTLLSWQLKVSPVLSPGRDFHYGQTIKTTGTESDAFTEKGSYSGIAIPYTVDDMLCELYAPDGYVFIDKGYVIRDGSGAEIKDKDKLKVTPPNFSEDKDRITWEIKDPMPTLKYIVRVCIVKRN